MSKQTVQVVKERAPGPIARLCNFLDILLFVFLIPVGFFFLDLVTDALLVSDYFQEWKDPGAHAAHEAALDECGKNLTLSCYSSAMSARAKFFVSVAIMLFPFAFYVVEVAMYYRLKTFYYMQGLSQQVLMQYSSKNIASFAFLRLDDPYLHDDPDHRSQDRKSLYKRVRAALRDLSSRLVVLGLSVSPVNLVVGVIAWLTWPVRLFLLNLIHRIRMESSNDSDKIDRHSRNQRAYQTYASRAHLIEVCLCLSKFIICY